MPYIDCFLAPVPRDNRTAYETLARISAQVLIEYGAIRVMECWMDESGPDADSYHGIDARREAQHYPTFAHAAGAHPGERVAISFVEWPDKATRDAGMARVTSDPRMQFADMPPTFEGSRLIAAGFQPMIDTANDP